MLLLRTRQRHGTPYSDGVPATSRATICGLRALAHLRFLRWLAQTGRLVADGGARGGQLWRRGVRPMNSQWDGPEGPLAPLPVGTRAPAFALPQAPRSVLVLHRLGRRALVLAFYPMDWELVSREQLALYQAYADAFDRLGARLLGISTDHVHSHDAFARDARLRFPLLADDRPRGAVARRYGVFREAPGVSARALFVLDARRVIRFGKAYPDALNPGVDEVLTTLEALAAGGELPR